MSNPTPEQRTDATLAAQAFTPDPTAENARRARDVVLDEIAAELLAGGSWPADAGARIRAAEEGAAAATAARNAKFDVIHRLHGGGS